MTIAINALYIKWGINAGTETYFTNVVKPWYDDESTVSNYLLLCNDPPPWWAGPKEHFNIIIFAKSKNLISRGGTWDLCIVGDGDIIIDSSIEGLIVLPFQQPNEVANIMNQSKVFCLLSRKDHWARFFVRHPHVV